MTQRAIVALLFASAAAMIAAAAAIQPYNSMPSRIPNAALPIDSLPRRPVMQLAFARAQSDIDTVLETSRKKKEREANVADIRTGNRRDSRFLVPAYTLFLVALTLLIAEGSQDSARWLFRAGLAVAVVIAAVDWIENYGIEAALRAVENGAALSTATRRVMVAATFAKWILLGVIVLGLGLASALQERTWRRYLSLPLMALGVWTLAPIGRHAVDRFLVLGP